MERMGRDGEREEGDMPNKQNHIERNHRSVRARATKLDGKARFKPKRFDAMCPVKSGMLAKPRLLALDGSRCRTRIDDGEASEVLRDRVRVVVLERFVQ